MTRFLTRCIFLVACSVVFSLGAPGQQIVNAGPPPEIRSHIEALIKAWNSGSSDDWEKMAQQHFSPGELKRQPAEARKQIFDKARRDFGSISLGRVEGPDQPLLLHIKGSTGASGIIELQLEQDSPYLIEGLRVKTGEGNPAKPQTPVDSPSVNGAMSNEQLSRALDKYFGKLAGDDTFSGDALVAKDGKMVYAGSFGFADRANRVPNNAATRFNLGSINKSFTQAAIQQLIARGKLSLGDTVGKVLPDYPQEATRAATIEQLLQHSAGVADFFGDEFVQAAKDRFRSNADYYKLVSSLKPLFAPGTRTQYCNGCYIVLGAVIERVSGVTYEKYVEENIFKPAGMVATGPLQADGLNANVAMGYTRHTVDGNLRSNILMHGASGCAAGGGYTTAADLLNYAVALGHGGIPDVPPTTTTGIAGGAPGINSILKQSGPWTVVVLSNFDPPAGEEPARSLAEALSR